MVKLRHFFVFILILAALSACGGSKEPLDEQNPVDSLINDPNGALSSLELQSPEDDALFQCYLKTAETFAQQKGLWAYPVSIVSELAVRGVYVNWCKVEVDGQTLPAEQSRCGNDLIDGEVKTAGSYAMHVFGRQVGADDTVNPYGYKVVKVPVAGESGWRIEYNRNNGVVDALFAMFQLLPSEATVSSLELIIATGYDYIDQENDVRESISVDATTTEYINQLTTSVEEFERVLLDFYESLRAQVQQSIETANIPNKQSALTNLNNRVDEQIKIIQEHRDDLYNLLLELRPLDQCNQ